MRLGENGKSVVTGIPDILEFERLCYLIAHELSIAEYEGDWLRKFYFVERILRSMVKTGTFTWSAFRRAAQIALEEEKAKPLKTFHVLITTNLDSHPFREPKKIGPINTGLSTIHFLRFAELPPDVQTKLIRDHSDIGDGRLITSAWITRQTITARSYQSAYVTGSDSLTRFRCIFNFHGLFGTITLFGGGFPKPKTPFLPPPRYYVYPENWRQPEGEWVHLPRLEWKVETIKPDLLRRAYKFLSRYRQKDGLLIDIFHRACEMYTSALDSNVKWQQFLGLWQLLEIVGRMGAERMPDVEVKGRLAKILGDDTELVELIDALYEKRNRVVHAGKTELIEDADIRWVKMIADQCIRFCLYNASRLKTAEQVQAYLSLAGLSPKALKIRSALIRRFQRAARRAPAA